MNGDQSEEDGGGVTLTVKNGRARAAEIEAAEVMEGEAIVTEHTATGRID
jgi:hypothetical protein